MQCKKIEYSGKYNKQSKQINNEQANKVLMTYFYAFLNKKCSINQENL